VPTSAHPCPPMPTVSGQHVPIPWAVVGTVLSNYKFETLTTTHQTKIFDLGDSLHDIIIYDLL
jgi:hypothetical protein